MIADLAMIERRPHTPRLGHQVIAPIAAFVATKNEIDRRSLLRVAAEPGGELCLAESSGAGHIVEMRARRMLEARIRFIGHPDFDASTAAAEILGPMPGPVGRGNGLGKAKAREVLPSSDADLQNSKFLTREQEVHLFRKMNFLKYQAAQLRETIDPIRARSADLDRIEELLRAADAIRNRIIRSYLGLVVYIVKKYTEPSQDFLDLVSVGNFSLIKASERFDCRRGARFSTYATWAIINNFARRIPKDRSRRVRFATGREGLLQSLTDHRDSGLADAMDQEQCRCLIRRMLDYLDGREQMIIVRRFGLADDKQTLLEVGRELGISKERVRQLESRALDKLRTLVELQKLDAKDESTSGGDDADDR
jgi:RNA polymerase primary sigma factor